MRVLMIQPNYHCGGAEIAGNWPPAWVAYLAGSLKKAGESRRQFVNVSEASCAAWFTVQNGAFGMMAGSDRCTTETPGRSPGRSSLRERFQDMRG